MSGVGVEAVCAACAAPLPRGAVFCPRCGAVAAPAPAHDGTGSWSSATRSSSSSAQPPPPHLRGGPHNPFAPRPQPPVVDAAGPDDFHHRDGDGDGAGDNVRLVVIAVFVAAPLGAIGAWTLELNPLVGAVVGAVSGAVGVIIAGPKSG